ncbi:Lysosomal acid phosphatase [Sphaceloma murrayae]|uniref:Lysosomal acid phosphatase n=1 Tax=Sphaceloma murrayae TaxID=2082308 RepID=A0A2K1QV32_9PEZI|nr:Lysosomal acid phosphatase [Sphaceloma murrayae]
MAHIHLASAVLASLLAVPALAQDGNFTVWSSILYLRAGERTPAALSNLAPTLTSLGAQQMYAAGQYFRSQYLQDGSANRMQELESESPRTDQVYALTVDTQFTSASLQAFMLGMWPPTGNSSADTEGIPNQLVNGTIVENPVGGVNLPRISTAGVQDIDSLYVGGDIACTGFGRYASNALTTDLRTSLIEESQPTYDSIQSLLDPVFNRNVQSFEFAKSIYDYINYLNNYNRTASEFLSTQSDIIDRLRLYADTQQSIFYANLTASSPYNRSPQYATRGSISTIAGSTLAARVVSHFYAQQYAPASSSRLSVLVGDYAPLLSFLSLANLTSRLPGLALPASALAFELVSPASAAQNLTATGLPPAEQLSIRLRFRNGTGVHGTASFPGSGGEATAWSIFNRSSEDVNIPYNDFLVSMSEIATQGPGDWCYQCGATTVFCAAWNTTNTFDGVTGTRTVTRQRGALSNEVAGVIGAFVALAVAGLIAALLFFVVGFRVGRTEPIWVSRKRRSELGGFKGSQKLASDRDLSAGTGSKGAGGVGAVVEKTGEQRDGEGHARMGSWELKDQGAKVGDMKPWAEQRHGRVDSEGTLADRDMGHMGLDGARLGWGSRDDGDHVHINRQTGIDDRVEESRRMSVDSGNVDPFRDPVREEERV